MREIKFRAWHKLAKRMVVVDMVDFVLDAYRAHDGTSSSGSGHLRDIELMPYTGIKDKNGKDIYEGDICTAEGRMVYSSSAKEMVPGRYTVYWRDDRWHLRDQNKDGYQSGDYYYADEIDWQRCTVIGNIYEQQEHN